MKIKKEENTTSSPFLYIEVPQSSPVIANMQKVYIASKAKKDAEIKKQATENQLKVNVSQEQLGQPSKAEQSKTLQKLEELHNRTDIEVKDKIEKEKPLKKYIKIENEIVEPEVAVVPEEEPKHWQRKSFKNMQIVEKIEFLLNKPAYIPNIACEIKTDANVYVGVIKSCENDKVTIQQTTSLEPITVGVHDIIHMNLRPV